MEAAYDDAAGVTARFNKNLLNVLNRSNKAGALFSLGTLPREAVSTQQAIDYLEATRTVVEQCLNLVPEDRYSKDFRVEIERLIGRFNAQLLRE